MVETDRFPRFGLWRRTRRAAEGRLASMPLLILGPFFGALAVTGWAIAHPALTVSHGLVVKQQSTWAAVVTGVVIAIVALLTLMGAVMACSIAWYRLRGDRVWETVYLGRLGQVRFFELRCKEGVAPIDAVHLGAVECWVRMPSGRVVKFLPGKELAPDSTSLRLLVPTDYGSGPYEVRWYRAPEGERFGEVARLRRTMTDDEPETPSIALPAVVIG
jgi:hypothetical protein